MHPNALFRSDDIALHETLIDQIGFASVFAATPDGPRVAHTPIVFTGDGAVQFHLSRGNALTGHLAGITALICVNGPDAYISPRWYDEGDHVPTWNYVALELEGPVRRMEREGTEGLLDAIARREEARIGQGEPWQAQQVSTSRWNTLMRGIVGFEMEIRARRPTIKLSQDKTPAIRDAIASGLDRQGASAMAQLMKGLVA
jgi:transcriptional regulator